MMDIATGNVSPSVDASTIGKGRASKKNVRITGSFVRSSTEAFKPHNWVRIQSALNSYYLANFMAAVVLIDAYCTSVDIDATASTNNPPEVFALISDLCLVTYTLEVTALLVSFGFKPLIHDWMMMLDIIIVGCGWAEKIMASMADGALGFRTAVLRALRLVRIFRLMRLLKLGRTAAPWSFVSCHLKSCS